MSLLRLSDASVHKPRCFPQESGDFASSIAQGAALAAQLAAAPYATPIFAGELSIPPVTASTATAKTAFKSSRSQVSEDCDRYIMQSLTGGLVRSLPSRISPPFLPSRRHQRVPRATARGGNILEISQALESTPRSCLPSLCLRLPSL